MSSVVCAADFRMLNYPCGARGASVDGMIQGVGKPENLVLHCNIVVVRDGLVCRFLIYKSWSHTLVVRRVDEFRL